MDETWPEGSAALYDFLNCAAQAVLYAEGGDGKQAERHYFEASLACADAFPLSSDESAVLGKVLDIIRPMVEAVPAS